MKTIEKGLAFTLFSLCFDTLGKRRVAKNMGSPRARTKSGLIMQG